MDIEEKRGRRNLIINIVLLVILVILIVVFVLAKYVLSPMRVSGDSMCPTLHDGQIVLMRHTTELEKGDIVVYHHGDRLVVKRLIAVGGDRVSINADGTVSVNGELLVEDYILDGVNITDPNTMDITIAEGEYFFLGDNRDNSNDSEDYGPVKGENILGKLL